MASKELSYVFFRIEPAWYSYNSDQRKNHAVQSLEIVKEEYKVLTLFAKYERRKDRYLNLMNIDRNTWVRMFVHTYIP